MFEHAEIAGLAVQYDQDATATAYGPLSMDCECAYCRNFLAALDELPRPFFELLRKLGIDAAKPAEIVQYKREPNGLHFYGWWYHFAGQIVEAGYVEQDPAPHASLADGLRVTLKTNGELVAPGFPQPLVQIEFWASLPWKLLERE